MPKVSVYLPDDLYGAARDHQLPISTLAQQAIEQALHAKRTDDWVMRVRSRPARVLEPLDTLSALDAVRDEFGA